MAHEFTPDPARPPQSSGVADVQLVEAVTSHLARFERKLIEQQTQTREEISASIKGYAKVVDKVMENRLGQLASQMDITLERYRKDTKFDIERLDSRADTAFQEIDAVMAAVVNVDTRLTQATEAGAMLVANNPALKTAAEGWLKERTRPLWWAVVGSIAIHILTFAFWLAQAFGWLWWLGL